MYLPYLPTWHHLYITYIPPALPETNSSPPKIGHPKRKGLSPNHPFSGAILVLGRVYTASIHSFEKLIKRKHPITPKNNLTFKKPQEWKNISPTKDAAQKKLLFPNFLFPPSKKQPILASPQKNPATTNLLFPLHLFFRTVLPSSLVPGSFPPIRSWPLAKAMERQKRFENLHQSEAEETASEVFRKVSDGLGINGLYNPLIPWGILGL